MEPPRKMKKVQAVERKMCIICSKVASRSELSSPRDTDSVQVLLDAAKLQNFTPICDLEEFEYEEKLFYHRECRSTFTHRKTLDKFRPPKESSSSSEARRSSRDPSSHSGSSRVLDAVCIFCNKKSKYLPSSNSREDLLQSRTLCADAKIRNAAQAKLDQRMIAITSRELVAGEGHYHKSCYRNYTREMKPRTEDTSVVEDDDEAAYRKAEQEAYKMLFKDIRDSICVDPKVMRLTKLTEQFVQIMQSLGQREVKSHTKKHIRRKLESEFGTSLHFVACSNGRVLLYPDNLSVQTLVVESIKLEDELKTMKIQSGDKNTLRNAAVLIRSDILSLKPQPWPPHPDDLSRSELTASLEVFLRILLAGEKKSNDELSDKQKRLINSIGQDCIYAVSGGTQVPAKHILLPWGVKTLTGNVELIKVLNRLGHGVCYSRLEELETALSLKKQEREGVFLPTTSHPNVPTVLAFDNIDRLEETLSGSGTSHRVNGIIVQPQVNTVKPASPDLKHTKATKRSITPVQIEVPEYNAGKRVGPPAMKSQSTVCGPAEKLAVCKNILWSLTRLSNPQDQIISSWTGFNMETRDNITVNKDTVDYLPTINAPATQLSTVHNVLVQATKIKDELELAEIVCVFDQAMYAKAMEVQWKHLEDFQGLVLRMGVFHTICNLLSIIGKRFGSAGLRDLAVESGIIAEGSITSVLEGRQYNRGVRLCKLAYECFFRLAWKEFCLWLDAHHAEESSHLSETLNAINSLHDDVTHEALEKVMQNGSVSLVISRFLQFLELLRTKRGPLAAFWVSFLDMVNILLDLIRASREGDWLLHLSAVKRMIPWCFAYDKQNYSRYLPVYYCEMTRLPETHPEISKHMLDGGFSVQLGDRNTFGRIPVDQTIEETVNKDTQTAGGTKGFSLQPGAVCRFYMTAEYRSSCLRQLRRMTDVGNDKKTHPDLSPSRIKKDEAAVQSLENILQTNWTNPFQEETELVSLSTGATAPSDVSEDLTSAQKRGEEAYMKFEADRLEKGEKFFDAIPRMNLKTFDNVKPKKFKNSKNKEMMLKSDNKLFGHMVLVASSRKLNMEDVLKYPLGPIPWALANMEGSLKKTSKAALARKLEALAAPAEHLDTPSACIVDGMSMVQKMKGDNMTFEELANQLLASVLRQAGKSQRIDVVFDVYREMSIKAAERTSRGSETGIRLSNIIPGHRIQQWRRLLSCSASKMKLISFLAKMWQEPHVRRTLGEKLLYVTCDDLCYKIHHEEVTEEIELRSTQEEADTRVILHAKHAAAYMSSVIIVADDTDIILLCLAFQHEIDCELFVKCGTATRTRYIDIKKVSQALGEDVSRALPGLHAFTGCDTVSAFSGRGKVGALKLLMNSEKFIDGFQNLGSEWQLTDSLFKLLEEFTCKLYAIHTDITDVNQMRYELFRLKDGNVDSGQLPPCQDCLHLHAVRANYQAAIWQRSLVADPQTPSPMDCKGWVLSDSGDLIINWMTGDPAPERVIAFLSCKCKKTCKRPTCQCLMNGLPCTQACSLQICDNMKEDNPTEQDTDDSDSDSDNS